MGAYWIAHVTVHDAEAYGKYAALATDAIAQHGGKFLARAKGRYQQMEGTDHARNVVAYFPTFEDAVNCYNSDIYKQALSHAEGAATRDLVIVEEDPT